MSNSLTYMPEDFQAVIDGMATGSYTTESGWISKVPLDRAEEAIHRLRRGEGIEELLEEM